MRFTEETITDGVLARPFTLDDIPGVVWTPPQASEDLPLILFGHGGGQHAQAPGATARARRFVSAGFAVAAIDVPGHGNRPPSEEHNRLRAAFRARMAAGEPAWQSLADYNYALVAETVPEWQATLDALLKLGYGPVGYCGTSMGTAIGMPLTAREPRIAAAVFGLAGLDSLAEAAAGLTVPVEFLLQWDDQLVSREQSLALFDAIGSAEKTLHANPGNHGEVPAFELDSSLRFFARHLR
jgi:pimeloyl-ACP methyl ester carboxylesterase